MATGKEYGATHSEPPGASALALPPRRPAFSCGLSWPGRRGAGEPAASPPSLPRLALLRPRAAASAAAFRRFSAAPSPESNYFSLRSFAHPPGPRGRSGGRAAAHFPPPEAEAGPLGWGERGLGGARGAADGTICPSARGPAGPRREAPGAAARTPASSGMSGRGLARGFPAHARTRSPGSGPRARPKSWALLFRVQGLSSLK